MIINCESLDTSLESLAGVYNCDKDSIYNELKNANLERIYEGASDEYEIHRWLCSRLNLAPSEPDYVWWFHFTRVLEPQKFFKNGILPTDKILPIMRDEFYSFVKCFWTPEQWRENWDYGFKELPMTDALKFTPLWGCRPDYGPNGMLVKDVGLYPKRSRCGYFWERPEIVDGILTAIDRRFKTNIMQCFMDLAIASVVTFQAKPDRSLEEFTTPILLYLHSYLKQDESLCGVCNFDAKNKTIGPERVVKIETMEYDSSGRAVCSLVKQS